MRKTTLSALAASTLLLGGCAAYGGDPFGGLLGGIFGGGYDDRNLSDFERAAANACAREAEGYRYGRISVTRVEQNSRDTVRVDGRFETRDRSRDEWRCIFRSDGRIVDFDVG